MRADIKQPAGTFVLGEAPEVRPCTDTKIAAKASKGIKNRGQGRIGIKNAAKAALWEAKNRTGLLDLGLGPQCLLKRGHLLLLQLLQDLRFDFVELRQLCLTHVI